MHVMCARRLSVMCEIAPRRDQNIIARASSGSSGLRFQISVSRCIVSLASLAGYARAAGKEELGTPRVLWALYRFLHLPPCHRREQILLAEPWPGPLSIPTEQLRSTSSIWRSVSRVETTKKPRPLCWHYFPMTHPAESVSEQLVSVRQ